MNTNANTCKQYRLQGSHLLSIKNSAHCAAGMPSVSRVRRTPRYGPCLQLLFALSFGARESPVRIPLYFSQKLCSTLQHCSFASVSPSLHSYVNIVLANRNSSKGLPCGWALSLFPELIQASLFVSSVGHSRELQREVHMPILTMPHCPENNNPQVLTQITELCYPFKYL